MTDAQPPRFVRGFFFVAGRLGSTGPVSLRKQPFVGIGRLSLALGVGIGLVQTVAQANCTTAANTTTCDTAAPNPYTSRVGAGNTAAGDNQTVTVDFGAGISSGNDTAISLRDNAVITVNGTVQNASTNAGGGYNTGGNTIEFRNNGRLTIASGAQVLSNGSQVSAEAVNVQGTGNTIINDGLVNAVRGAAIWSQNAGTLTVVNNGTISTGSLANPNRTATVIGGNTNAGIDFTNRGTVYGSLNLGSGADNLRLYTGSLITGNFSGGGGIDNIYLNGAGSDSLAGNMSGFEYLYKQDAGTWELTGTINGLVAANVQAGTLILSGDNTNFTGTTTVSSGATLQGRAQSLPTAISNDGLVRFAQTDNGTYGGVISGTGGVEKTGTGTLTLGSPLAYAGATSVVQGTLILTGDNSGYAGPASVSGGATLQGEAASLPGDISNDGLVRFAQTADGSYGGVISGAGGVEKAGRGMLTVSEAQTYTGPTAVEQGTLLLTGSLTSDTTVDRFATLMGDGTITGDVANAGVLSPGTPGSIGTFTIIGNYVGNDGTLATRVGGSPEAPVADVLRISGAGNTASGATGIVVTDAGGLGAPTTGNGILVVEAVSGAQTAADSFALADRVAGGAYEYNLTRGVGAGTQQNWYLSTYSEPPTPPDPGPDPEPEPAKPNYRVETSNYTALPALQRLYTYALVDTLEQRRGPLGASAAPTTADAASWARAVGSFGDVTGSGAEGLDIAYASGFLQAGIDAIVASDGQGGQISSGLFLALGTAGADTATQADGNTGNASFGAWSGGVYGTWISNSGLYADALAQVTRFAGAEATSAGGQTISTGGWSESLSLETGYRLDVTQRAALTPQGQIVLENFTLDGTSDDFGDVDFENGFAARGRLGLEFGSSVERTDVTLRASLWHVFADNPQTTFSSLGGTNPVDFTSDSGSTWLELDAGLSAEVDEQLRLFGNASYEYAFEGSRQAGSARIGFTYAW